ncbi:Tagatose-6-phosphate kinase [Vibrio aerogenes CECT 7868]|uniref:Phosphofructokinase n=1 Tax=Vibrio aerogenes CECT 7868 TaxID=1216006 RepID=A0A1M5ZU18_9VIBR|nr:1-phosphofructokinase [Vibrio aerogenes]SHI27767.1 Tagatose-6-phosphate kinase [Vibrio aerogenes CECT 7868]
MTKKVVTITLNPALDLTGSLDTLNQGSVSLVREGSLHAAGKGVNVAQVLSDLGAEVTVTGFLGQENQDVFCQLFETIGAKDEFIRVAGATRINVKLVESSGDVSDINFPGVEVSSEAIAAFEKTLFRLAGDHEYFVLAGSLPKGVSPQQCAGWIKQLHQLGKKVLFDSSRDALAAGLDAHPWLIKPNDEELSHFVGQTLSTVSECQSAASELASRQIENIVVSMGADGVMWLHNNEWLHAKPPRMEVISTVGAGDTLVAGLCWGHMQEMKKQELLTFATALSALAVTQVGVGVPDRNELATLQQKIQLQPYSPQASN